MKAKQALLGEELKKAQETIEEKIAQGKGIPSLKSTSLLSLPFRPRGVTDLTVECLRASPLPRILLTLPRLFEFDPLECAFCFLPGPRQIQHEGSGKGNRVYGTA